jgi:hypothetical protein
VSQQPFNVRSEILAQIAKTQDENMRSILLLMLGVLDEISKKIDGVLADEKSLREAVLNGHSLTHDDDHEWIKGQRQLDCHKVCSWALVKMQEEEDAQEAKTNRIRKMIDKALEHAVTVILTGVALYFGFVK